MLKLKLDWHESMLDSSQAKDSWVLQDKNWSENGLCLSRIVSEVGKATKEEGSLGGADPCRPRSNILKPFFNKRATPKKQDADWPDEQIFLAFQSIVRVTVFLMIVEVGDLADVERSTANATKLHHSSEDLGVECPPDQKQGDTNQSNVVRPKDMDPSNHVS